jgi:threonine aldolase
MVGRLQEDHLRARRLARGLSTLDGIVLDGEEPATNMVFLNLSDEVDLAADEVADGLKKRGVLAGISGRRRFRLVTHYEIDDHGIDTAIAAFKDVLQ